MSYREFLNRLLTVIFTIIALLALWHLQSILMLGFLSVILAVALSIPTELLQKRGLHHVLAKTLAIIGAGILSVLLVIWIFPTIVNESTRLLVSMPIAFRQSVEAYADWRTQNELLTAYLPAPDYTELEDVVATLGFEIDSLSDLTIQLTNSALPLLPGIGSLVFGIIANLIVVIFVSIFFLMDPESYVRAGKLLVPHSYQTRLFEIFGELYRTLRAWIAAQSIAIVISMALIWLILGGVLGMPHALPVAVIAGIATFVPNIGVFLPLIPIVVFTLADDPSRLWIVVLAYLLIQFTESNILTPYVVKTNLHIPAGALLLFQLASATLFGPLGLLLAVPLLAVIITLVREIYSYDILGLKDVDISPTVEVVDTQKPSSSMPASSPPEQALL